MPVMSHEQLAIDQKDVRFHALKSVRQGVLQGACVFVIVVRMGSRQDGFGVLGMGCG
jgi:predicted AAA+ superfamily ATPase